MRATVHVGTHDTHGVVQGRLLDGYRREVCRDRFDRAGVRPWGRSRHTTSSARGHVESESAAETLDGTVTRTTLRWWTDVHLSADRNGEEVRVRTVTTGDSWRNEQCWHCHRRALPGQVVICQLLDKGPLTRTRFLIHARCVRELLADAPPDADELAFEELKSLIHATGEAFPE